MGILNVEDEKGVHLASLHAEPGAPVRLVLPSGAKLFVRRSTSEAEVTLQPGEQQDFSRLTFAAASTKSRGSISSSLSHGLFARPFGRAYYYGYVDGHDSYLPVERLTAGQPLEQTVAVTPPPPRATYLLWGASAAAAVSSGVFAAIAWDARRDYERTEYEREAQLSSRRFSLNASLAIGSAAVALAAAGIGYWLSSRSDH